MLEAKATPCPPGTFPPSVSMADIKSIMDLWNSFSALAILEEPSSKPSFPLRGFGLCMVLFHQSTVGLSSLVGDVSTDLLLHLPHVCGGCVHLRSHPLLSLLLLQKPFLGIAWQAGHLLPWSCNCPSTTLVIFAAEKQAWATTAPNPACIQVCTHLMG